MGNLYFFKKKPSMPKEVMKYDLRLPNSIVIGDFLLLKPDKDKISGLRKYSLIQKVFAQTPTEVLKRGEQVITDVNNRIADMVCGWSFSEECNKKNVLRFLKHAPYLHRHLYFSFSLLFVSEHNLYPSSSFSNDRETIKQYDVYEAENKPLKYPLANKFLKYPVAVKDNNQQDAYLLLHRAYSHAGLSIAHWLSATLIELHELDGQDGVPHEIEVLWAATHIYDWSYDGKPTDVAKLEYLYDNLDVFYEMSAYIVEFYENALEYTAR